MKVHEIFYNIYYFSDEDFKLFEKFLLSPYFNTMKSQIIVYRIIRNNISYIPSKRYEELKILIIKETKYSETTVRKILSYLNDMYIEYTRIQAYKNEDFYKELFVCNYLLLKGNYNFLSKRIQYIDKMLSDGTAYDQDYFLKMFDKNILEYNTITTSEELLNPVIKLSKQKEFTLESTKNLTIFYISKATVNLVNYVFQCNGEVIGNQDYPVDMEVLFKSANSSNLKSYNKFQKTTIKLFFKLYKLFNNLLNDSFYDEYKDYFYKVKHLYNIDCQKMHLSIILNYCFLRQRIKDDNKFYIPEALIILYDYIDKEFYKNDITEYLHPIIYRNYVINCVIAGRKDFLKKFIDKHSTKLHPSEMYTMKIYGMANYYYLNDDYNLALESVEKLTNPKDLYKYDIVNLKIKIFYALNRFEDIECLLHNYTEILKNDSCLTKNDYAKYYYLVVFMRKYLLAYYNYETTHDTFKFEYLLKLIAKRTDFSMKNWLLKIVTDFITKHNAKYSKKNINSEY